MLKLEFLAQEDLAYIRPQLRIRIGYDNPLLERGHIQITDDEPHRLCEMVVNCYGRRYKVKSTTHNFSRSRETIKVFPYYVESAEPYQGSFMFDYPQEMRFFEVLREFHELGKINADTYIRLAEIAGLSRKELIDKVYKSQKGLRGKNGAIIGAILGANESMYGAIIGAGIGGSLATILSGLIEVRREKKNIVDEIERFLLKYDLNIRASDTFNHIL